MEPNQKIIDLAYYKLFDSVYKKYMTDDPRDHVLNFIKAVVDSSKAEIKDPKLLLEWAKQRGCKLKDKRA